MIRDMFRDYTMRWWQVSLLKVSMVAFGLAVGATWPGAFEGWLLWLWLIFLLPAAYLSYVFYPQMWRRRRK